ncbi:hypothetical protein ACIHAA_10090 [Streptomyces sp. NPDC052040]|uniref:hypothetical protein n=1 Tax=Streptomyces sp. NPDC052040 TaxID=3365682 RepID=UPI0037D430DE
MTTEEATAQAHADDGEWADGYVPSAAAIAAAQQAVRELAARGAEVSVKTKWWGFEIHLNAEAASKASELAEYIGDVAGNALPDPYGQIIEVFCKVKAAWIKEVGQTYGCKLVSPWIAPGMLIPVSLKPTQDTNLWWTVFERSTGWNEDQKFPAHHSASNPALAEYDGRLYCVHRGHGNGDQQLWWTVYDPDGSSWSDDVPFPAHSSAAGPALAVFNGKLHCVHRGSGNDTKLWHTTFDGTRWSSDAQLPAHSSSVGPALAVFNGKLHCVHKGASSDNQLWHTTFDGSRWSSDNRLPAHSTASNPALAVFNGKLHCVHRGSGNDTKLWHATFDGTGWSADTQLPAHSSLEGPALAVFEDRLYCIHRGVSNDQQLWWSSYILFWGPDTKFGAHSSGAGPAVIAYRDKNAASSQLLCVHRGYGNKSASHDAAGPTR